ncbi:MAG TPA: hypothetical protein DCS11_06110 [Syntrophus sp. (in: bacteria)]|nr:hypothetical protein [Syntrophus sp. (in: bacteria)]
MNVLLSGATRDGRTGFAGRLADEFRRQDLLPGGFLCPPAEQDGAGPAYVIRDLLSGQARPFARLHNPERAPAPAKGETAIGRWRVDAIKPAEKNVVFAGAEAAGAGVRGFLPGVPEGIRFEGQRQGLGFCIGGRHVVEQE